MRFLARRGRNGNLARRIGGGDFEWCQTCVIGFDTYLCDFGRDYLTLVSYAYRILFISLENHFWILEFVTKDHTQIPIMIVTKMG